MSVRTYDSFVVGTLHYYTYYLKEHTIDCRVVFVFLSFRFAWF